jgi:transglutaminase-like putative cysteine protease
MQLEFYSGPKYSIRRKCIVSNIPAGSLESECFEPVLCSTPSIDFDNEAVQAFVAENSQENGSDLERAVSLYYAVRDQIRYDPYTISHELGDYSASHTLKTGRGWCVTKAILYAACCRAAGIPARLGYADVRNHLSTANLRRLMGTDIFYWHGYTDVYLNRTWVKATPAFNIELCNKFRLKPLEFNGLADSIYHPFDIDGRTHMEYLNYRGEFVDLPFDTMINDLYRVYPGLKDDLRQGDFRREVDLETSR